MYIFDLQSVLQSANCTTDCIADSDQTCTFQCVIQTRIFQKYDWRFHESSSWHEPLRLLQYNYNKHMPIDYISEDKICTF